MPRNPKAKTSPRAAPSSNSKKPRSKLTKLSKSKRRTRQSDSLFWVFFFAGSFWALYTLYRVVGREELADLHSELQLESQYLAHLFQSHALDGVGGGGDPPIQPLKVSPVASVILSEAKQQQPDSQRTLQKDPAQNNGQPAQPQAAATQQKAEASAATVAPPPPPQTLASFSHSAAIHHNHLQQQVQQQQQQQNPIPGQQQPQTQQQQHQPYKIDFTNLNPTRNHALVIPYRNRKFHLEQFIEHMGPYLKRNFPSESFELWIVEQDDDFLFNRAWLANVGITQIKYQNKLYKYQRLQQQQQSKFGHLPLTVPPPPKCIILHDVDLIPTVEGVPYINCTRPIQLGSELAHFNNSIPYPIYTGGVGPSMTLDHWVKINGMSNDFYGWGGEDDELWHRLRLTGLLKKPVLRKTPAPAPNKKPYRGPKFWPPEIIRPPKGKGKFRPISEAQTVHHNEKHHNQWKRIGYMLELMQNNSARWKKDGLNDMRMTITGDAMTVTHLESIGFNNHSVPTDPTVLSSSQATTTTVTRKHYQTAKSKGSVISSLSIEPSALASFVAIHHIKAIPKVTALEFIHVTQTDGGRIERAGAKAGIAWGACHYHHAIEVKMGCPDRDDPEWEGKARQLKSRASHTPWHSPLQDFEENPYKGRPTFAVVRNPYDRLIDFFYCPWNGYKGEKTPNATDLNRFLQHAMFPPRPLEDKNRKRKKGEPEPQPPTPTAFLHLRPQFHYIFANDKLQLYSLPFVTHVLRYENIATDFKKVMEKYSLHNKVILPERTPSGSKYEKTLTPLDFTAKTLDMIHRFYAGDFGRFGYRQIQHAPIHRPAPKKPPVQQQQQQQEQDQHEQAQQQQQEAMSVQEQQSKKFHAEQAEQHQEAKELQEQQQQKAKRPQEVQQQQAKQAQPPPQERGKLDQPKGGAR